ncbi:MAG: transporter substrate-binding domain-containing protein [Gammaproteobacteria bacterium]|nr:transporter substrate-binding domain-containing protein [Gammaproteobacteria bacterium]
MTKTAVTYRTSCKYAFLIILTSLFTLLNLTGCSGSGNDDNALLNTGDFNQILEKEELRVLIPRSENNIYLPRKGFPLDLELDQIKEFADKHNLKLKKVYVPDFDQLISKLIDGYGDIIAANMTVTADRKEFVDFTLPVRHVKQQLIQRQSDKPINKKSLLSKKTIAIKPSSSFWKTAQKLKDRNPSINILSLQNHLDFDEILDKLANKEFDATIQDSNLIESVKTYRFDIKSTLYLSGEEPVAWAIRQNNPLLKHALDQYIKNEKLRESDDKYHQTDLKDIKKRKVIRMITRNNAANYFLYKGQLLGFEYELAQQFSRNNRLNLEIIVPPDDEDMFDWLLQGKGDFIAASLTPTRERLNKDIKFSRHYIKTKHQLVQRYNEDIITDVKQLNHRTIAIRRNSAYLETIEKIQRDGIKLDIEFVEHDLETEDIINRVAIGKYDLTLADSHLLDLELLWRDDIRAALTLSEEKNVGWVTRKNNPALLNAINRFHKRNHKSLEYNLSYKKYFQTAAHANPEETRDTTNTSLSPYDDMVKKYAKKYEFDWKLITAQMYQESRFDPDATSWVGAQGLLQVMPKTGEEFGFTNLNDPETGLHAGIKYMQWVQNRFDHELPVKDRMWFTLAAYNAGIGHVRDARHLARRMGWNANRWFNNVERAMLLLRLKKYYRKARFGFVRGREPVKYVRNIKQHYEAYNKLLATDVASLNATQ